MTKIQLINDLYAIHVELKKLDRNSEMYAALMREEEKLSRQLNELLEDERSSNLLAVNSG